MTFVSHLLLYCYCAGQLFKVIQGQAYSNPLGCTSTCNPPPSLVSVDLGQIFYTKFIPWTPYYSTIDSECFSTFPLEGQDDVYQIYESRTYINGSREVFSYLLYNQTAGILTSKSPSCSYQDTAFDKSADGTYILYRCYLDGGCQGFNTGPPILQVFGLSATYGALTPNQISQIENIIQKDGYPPRRYHFLPMRYAAQCITSRSCALPSGSGRLYK